MNKKFMKKHPKEWTAEDKYNCAIMVGVLLACLKASKEYK